MSALTTRSPLVRHISNVHADDIHALLPLPNGTFISGSKDNALKQWRMNGDFVKNVYTNQTGNYASWITALSTMGDRYWLSGTRDGFVDVWDHNGRHIQPFHDTVFPVGPDTHRCKDRNADRVNCLSDRSQFTEGPSFSVGWPQHFTNYQVTPGSHLQVGRLASCRTHTNDWVYCIKPLSDRSYLVVTGARLETFVFESNRWRGSLHIDESTTYRRGLQRPFISSITLLEGTPSSYGVAVFGGAVKIYDLAQRRTTFQAHEHRDRVWMIETMGPQNFASCADDGLIKLWDPRSAGSTRTIQNRSDGVAARVSVLLRTGEHTLLSASCPNDLNDREKASFSIWDLRV
jgi:WD40 repeat protein